MSRTTDIQAKVVAMLNRDGFGIDATFAVPTGEPVYDPATGIATQTTTPAVVHVSVPLSAILNPRAADSSLRGEAVIYVPARDLTFTPSVGQSVTIDNVTYSVLDVVPYRLTDGVVAYKLPIRRQEVVTP